MHYSLKYTLLTWVLFLSVASASTKEATNYPTTGKMDSVVLAAVIQVLGLIGISFFANKWLSDYNERKTARLERFKIQQQIFRDFSRSVTTTIALGGKLAIYEVGWVSADRTIADGNFDYYNRKVDEYTAIVEENLGVLNSQSSLSKYAFDNPKIAEGINGLINLATKRPRGYEEINVTRPKDRNILNQELKKYGSIYKEKRLNVLDLMSAEINQWMSNKKGKIKK